MSFLTDRIKFSKDRDWFTPTAGRGGDEWCNSSVYLGIPFIGYLTVFTGKQFNRQDWWLSGGSSKDGIWSMTWVSPDYTKVATVDLDYDPLDNPCPHTKTFVWIYKNAKTIEDLDDLAEVDD